MAEGLTVLRAGFCRRRPESAGLLLPRNDHGATGRNPDGHEIAAKVDLPGWGVRVGSLSPGSQAAKGEREGNRGAPLQNRPGTVVRHARRAHFRRGRWDYGPGPHATGAVPPGGSYKMNERLDWRLVNARLALANQAMERALQPSPERIAKVYRDRAQRLAVVPPNAAAA